jgi:hypothetical protein
MEVEMVSHGGQASEEMAVVSRWVSWYYENSATLLDHRYESKNSRL